LTNASALSATSRQVTEAQRAFALVFGTLAPLIAKLSRRSLTPF
jgi:hypothetical protein